MRVWGTSGYVMGDRERAMKTVQLLTSKRVAEMLSIPEGTLRYWRNVGIGPVWHKLEGSIRYDVDDVSRYVEKNRRIPSVRAYMEEKTCCIGEVKPGTTTSQLRVGANAGRPVKPRSPEPERLNRN